MLTPFCQSFVPHQPVYGREVLAMSAAIGHCLHVHSARAAFMLWYLPARDVCGLTSEAMDYVTSLDGLIGFGID
jgi:hypothetical protein